MKICYFGNYKANYSRNVVLRRGGLNENNVEVIECNDRSKGFLKFLGQELKQILEKVYEK